jgi:hypothetical protein
MDDEDLLARWLPTIQYDSMESYSADAVQTMTDCAPTGSQSGNQLRTSNERLSEFTCPEWQACWPALPARDDRNPDADPC